MATLGSTDAGKGTGYLAINWLSDFSVTREAYLYSLATIVLSSRGLSICITDWSCLSEHLGHSYAKYMHTITFLMINTRPESLWLPFDNIFPWGRTFGVSRYTIWILKKGDMFRGRSNWRVSSARVYGYRFFGLVILWSRLWIIYRLWTKFTAKIYFIEHWISIRYIFRVASELYHLFISVVWVVEINYTIMTK